MRDRTPRAARAALLAGVVGQLLATAPLRAQQPTAADWRDRLLRAARATTFGPERAPVADRTVPRGASTAGIPDVTFAAATARRGDVGVAGRITSRTAYPRLGIPAGVSYLWVVTRPTVRMAIVPADAARPAYWLPSRQHTPGSTSPGTLDDPCRINPFATQLGLSRPPGGTRLMMAACTCVNGKWMHAEGFEDALTFTNARVLLAR